MQSLWCLNRSKMHRLVCSLVLCSSIFQAVTGTAYYVDSNDGDDKNNDGKSLASPFETIQACVNAIKDQGDECRIRKGRYHEVVKISGKHGSEDKPIIISGYENERPLIDGTVPVTTAGGWQKLFPSDPNNGIYYTSIKEDVYQLFVDDEMMTNARWPDALWKDFSVFNYKHWAASAASSERGKMVDAKNNLDKLPFNVKGAMAVLNIGSFNTFVAEVTDHEVGDNFFKYDDIFGDVHFKPSHNIYFLEDKLEFVNQPTEWFYDKDKKILYLWPSDGKNPTGRKIHGKVLDYAMEITDSTHVTFRNLDFFGAAVTASSTTVKRMIDQLTFDSLKFNFPSYSKRMLKEVNPPNWIKIIAMHGKRTKAIRGSINFINNEIYGADGAAIEYDGINNTVTNNLFSRNDWSGAMSQVPNGGLATIISSGIGDKFTRNTMAYNGAAAGYRPWDTPYMALNYIYGQCWGLIQNDGSAVQYQRRAQSNGYITKNWIHSSPKCGIRFDDSNPPKMGYDGFVTDNVVWNTRGIVVKGDRQTVTNNIAFDKTFDRHSGPSALKCTLCVLKYVGKSKKILNANSLVTNNGADSASGGKRGKSIQPLAGKTEHNVIADVREQVVDAENRDFRPRESSRYEDEKVGPYAEPSGRQLRYYWIPGRQVEQASQPIPRNASVVAERDALIWLGGYKALKHDVYLGESAKEVSSADHSSKVFAKTINAERNIYYVPRRSLKTGQSYFWRVDAVLASGKVVKGGVWTFTM